MKIKIKNKKYKSVYTTHTIMITNPFGADWFVSSGPVLMCDFPLLQMIKYIEKKTYWNQKHKTEL